MWQSHLHLSCPQTHAPGQITTTNTRTSLLRDRNTIEHFPRTILHWNSLNKDTAESSSLDIFKNRLPWSAVCVPAHRRDIPDIGLPREFADYQAEAETWLKFVHTTTSATSTSTPTVEYEHRVRLYEYPKFVLELYSSILSTSNEHYISGNS